jgi:hypothetical protein
VTGGLREAFLDLENVLLLLLGQDRQGGADILEVTVLGREFLGGLLLLDTGG